MKLFATALVLGCLAGNIFANFISFGLFEEYYYFDEDNLCKRI